MTCITLKSSILFILLLELQSFGVYSIPGPYITDCKYYPLSFENILTFICSNETNNDLTKEIRSSNHVVCQSSNDRPDFDKTTVLRFRHCQFPTFPESLLTGFNSLTELDVASTGITELRVRDLPRNPAKLKTLNLASNPIEVIDSELLRVLEPTLERLDLSKSEISDIPHDTFKGFTKLFDLQLRGNKLTSAALHFDVTNKVRFLDLSCNPIEELHNNAFYHLEHLEELRITHSPLKIIDTGTFLPLKKLKSLTLFSNQIAKIAQDTFKELTQLKELRLHGNQLTSAALHFDHGSQLNCLYLSDNVINELRVGDFLHLTELRSLYLTNVQLQTIELGTFSPLINLGSLDLSNNQLSTIDFNLFAPSMPTLHTLTLNSNQLRELDNDFNGLFPGLYDLMITENQFNCTYLARFMRMLIKRSYIFRRNPSVHHYPNINGISCEYETEQQQQQQSNLSILEQQTREEKTAQRGFTSGFNVAIFVLLLWISLANFVICGAIVLVGRRAAVYQSN